ncbi:SDR family oxidoreductase [Mycobacterium conspicuum]|jgi:NAD(P)-dependent dehydrogenase (short-subunit alcohol dehydrogenase family)|uniref:Short-chain dehydrogenase n=1 Tax=Mycobacterium conspicuum TaxID=44010 RepID=A0A1X1T5X9_9MYCO|nr:SDR family oxidoreductase [Mycobacterium conspicuum]ORV39950.1 short-chain dehydrogenase [Mycobacterium conspicuum]BBZ42388.1 short-chain dehydrogenase [Mycobacterium conspicuum]
MNSDQIVALVTGANRGLGKHFATQLVQRGAKVYAAARRPDTIDIPGVEAVQLDITDPTSVGRAADQAGDVTLLINNAGSSTRAGLLSGSLEDIRLEMDTHYFGTLNAIRAFVPIIEGNGGGAILNMLSVLSWLHLPGSGAYGAAKAAAWAMTDALRQELAPRGIHVTAVHVGYMDTDMAAFAPADQKTDPAVVAELALDGLFAGLPEVLADEQTRTVKAQLSSTS